MATVAILGPNLKARLELASLLASLGHQPMHAADLRDFQQLVKVGPQVLLAVESGEGDLLTSWIAEARRLAPLLPVVVCLGERSAVRALEYLRLGVADCLSPPLTAQALAPCIRKALRLQGTLVELVVSPAQPRPLGTWAWTGVILLGAVLLGALWHLRTQRRQALARTFSWDLPYPHPAGVAAAAGSLWIGDWYSPAVYEHDKTTLEIRRVRSLPQEFPVALVFAEGALWIGGADGRVWKHLLDARFTLLSTYRLPGRATVGLCYDGLYLWSLDRLQRKIRQHLLDDRLTLVQEFPYEGSPAALACDRSSLWSVEESAGEIRRHELADPSQVLWRAPLREYGRGPYKVTGLAADGCFLWSVAELPTGGGPGKLFRHPIEALLPPVR